MGRVVDQGGEPIRAVYVSLHYGEGLNEIQDTDAGGWYTFAGRPAYEHRLVAHRDGYADQERVVTPRPDRAIWVNFTLTPT